MTPAKLLTYGPAVGLVGLAVYRLSLGDVTGFAAALATAVGLHGAANSGPKPAS